MVFDVLYFIAAFELAFYGCMVANRRWLFTAYRQMIAGDDYRPYAPGDGRPSPYAAADHDDYDGFEVDY